MDFKKEFEGKRITVMGLGLLGRGVGDIAYLAECGADLIVTDLKTEEQLKNSLDTLKGYSGIRYVLGEHRLEDFENRDLILKASGVSLDSPYILHAEEKGIHVAMSAAIFAKLSGIPIIGVTGTRGKSTVTHMIHHVLTERTEGLSPSSSGVAGQGIILGGNVRGVSNLQLLKEVTEDSVGVFELDSWQLQGFGYERISPQISVFTNLMSDHQNYYEKKPEQYFLDKAQIFLHQHAGDTLVTTPETFEKIKLFASKIGITLPQEVELGDVSLIPEECVLKVQGEHNRVNAALAYLALRATSLPEAGIWSALSTFTALPGRLEFLREINGISIYNDNNATTPEATSAGLAAVAKGKNVILIMGGADKKLDTSGLLEGIEMYAKKVVLLSGTGTEILRAKLPDAPVCESLADAVTTAMASAETGDVILFSPAFASFGMFQNEYDRNDQFVELVKKL